MATQRTSLNVSLTPELERFIISRVASGRYQTASEVVRAALRLLERSEAREDSPSRRSAGGTQPPPERA
jgi:antitoxin ParD1/3/4